MKHFALHLAVGVTASLFLSTAAASRAASFNQRHDTAMPVAPSGIALLDATQRTVIVGDNRGLSSLRSSGVRFAPVARKKTAEPVTAVASTKIDGTLYIAYSIRGKASVQIAEATGRGTIGTGPTVALDGRPRSITTVPGRGFIVTHSSGVDLLEPASAGAFRRRELSRIGGAVDAAPIDLDGDAELDLIIANQPLGEILVLKGRPDAPPRAMMSVRTQRNPRRVLAANIDADAAQEIIVLGNLGLSVHDRSREGTVLEEQLIRDEPHLADIATSDLDSDGISDLIFSNRNRSIVSSLLSTESGRFTPGPAFLAGLGPGQLMVSRLTSATRSDIIVINQISNTMTHLRHDHRGLDGIPVIAASIGSIGGATVGHFDDDENLDLVLTGNQSGRIETHLGYGNGHFRPVASMPVGMTPRAIVSGDWDGDGTTDLAVADFGNDQLAILQGNGKGGFSVPVYVATGNGPIALMKGDFGGPAGIDLAVANRVSESVSIIHGDGHGRFEPGPNFRVGPRPVFLIVGDADRDGDTDIVVGNTQYETLTIIPREADGFGEPFHRVLGDTPEPSAAIDVTGDGLPELLVPNSSSARIDILQGKKGTFKTLQSIEVGRLPSAVEIGDFDADGNDDLAVIHASTGVVSIHLRIDESP